MDEEQHSLTPAGKKLDEAQLELDPANPCQDGFRKVFFGQVSDPRYAEHPGPEESLDDELERAAMEDPAAEHLKVHEPSQPTLWRLIVLFLMAIGGLGLVFLWRK